VATINSSSERLDWPDAAKEAAVEDHGLFRQLALSRRRALEQRLVVVAAIATVPARSVPSKTVHAPRPTPRPIPSPDLAVGVQRRQPLALLRPIVAPLTRPG
jgi:hypothetical protein